MINYLINIYINYRHYELIQWRDGILFHLNQLRYNAHLMPPRDATLHTTLIDQIGFWENQLDVVNLLILHHHDRIADWGHWLMNIMLP